MMMIVIIIKTNRRRDIEKVEWRGAVSNHMFYKQNTNQKDRKSGEEKMFERAGENFKI